MTRIVATGTSGQVVSAMRELVPDYQGLELICLGRPEIDFLSPVHAAHRIIDLAPDIIVNTAAYTAVDQAEDEAELANAINAKAPGILAQCSAKHGIPIIHLSTDYVFSGAAIMAYRETDATGPRTVYGKSKLQGEQAVAAANPRHLILRTAWLYSPFGKNFVKTMLSLARNRASLGVVNDQIGNPTAAHDVASNIFHIIDRLVGQPENKAYLGTFHMTGADEVTWYEFARLIFSVSGKMGGPSTQIVPITTAEFPTKAQRPGNSRLDCSKITEVFGLKRHRLVDSLAQVLKSCALAENWR